MGRLLESTHDVTLIQLVVGLVRGASSDLI